MRGKYRETNHQLTGSAAADAIHSSPPFFNLHTWLWCGRFPIMRRFLASLVVGVLAWSFVAPLALALTTTTPALCCRRSGKHHCMSGMSGMAGPGNQQLAFQALPTRCPCCSQVATATVVARLAVSTTTTRYSPSEILTVSQDSLLVHSRFHSPITQRGPPARLFNR
jgi:hypothetical protein